VTDYDITDATMDALQDTTRLRSFTPSVDYHRYVVKVMRDRYDPDGGSVQLKVTALGPIDARHLAWEQGRELGLRHHVVVRVTLECPCGHAEHEFPCIAWGCTCERVAP